MCCTPRSVKDANKVYHTVPCGECPICSARRASAWSFRLMQEDKKAESSYFLTLTYDTLHVPITERKRMGLNKADLQKFFKRVRDAHVRKGSRTKIKYYAVGEYGSRTFRPHYHAIVFNLELDKLYSQSDCLKLKLTDYDGKTEVSNSCWKLGATTVGRVTEASVGYTLKYISKGRTVPKYKGDDRLPEFSVMSKRLGANYLTKEVIKWHTDDVEQRLYCTVPGGVKISMPRYYKDRIYSEEQRAQIACYFKAKMDEEQAKLYGSDTIPTPVDYMQKEYERSEAIKAAFIKQKFDNKNQLL